MGAGGPALPGSLWKEALPLSPSWAAPWEPSAFVKLVLPGGVLAQRFLFAPRSWPSGFVERAICSSPNPSIPPPSGSVWVPSQFCSLLFEEKMGLNHLWVPMGKTEAQRSSDSLKVT